VFITNSKHTKDALHKTIQAHWNNANLTTKTVLNNYREKLRDFIRNWWEIKPWCCGGVWW